MNCGRPDDRVAYCLAEAAHEATDVNLTEERAL